MYQFILLIHVFAAICIIALVLVQQGKGATTGAAFGSGASNTVFGSRGSGSFLFRVTISFTAIFFITSLALNYLAAHSIKQEQEMALPIVPMKHLSPERTMPAPVGTPATSVEPVIKAPVTSVPTITVPATSVAPKAKFAPGKTLPQTNLRHAPVVAPAPAQAHGQAAKPVKSSKTKKNNAGDTEKNSEKDLIIN